ncbi:putative 20S proteasome subunit alpha type 2 [Cercophora scortea]|uniref:20S proteasome subunit alpha type 2 n=1 Tax=Cercophora scortea TaxID=314031 RepID=A0AAE0IXF0_9PEZI|nr:putative 20S proteasome subunit alpha type 2 [Cercophora scortea]
MIPSLLETTSSYLQIAEQRGSTTSLGSLGNPPPHNMEYKQQKPAPPRVKPRIIIHGGAGNITPASIPPDLYAEYRASLLTIISKTNSYMHTPSPTFPSALETATFAVTLLENSPLYNSGHGAVFTRDGLNELEASIMVSRGRAKRAVGVMGLRHVKNPILLARAILEHGDADLGAKTTTTTTTTPTPQKQQSDLNVPSAQGHSQIHGAAAEQLAKKYGLELVEPEYFYTRKRWDEHIRALEREKRGEGLGSWSSDEYLPQGTCGAIALDADGVVCCATSTGGLTNKLTGRIGDTPTVGAGFWAEEWTEEGDPSSSSGEDGSPAVELSGPLKGLIADCLPSLFIYAPVPVPVSGGLLRTTRSVAISGTGNGDSFLRTTAARTVAAIARFSGVSSAVAVTKVTGPDGELQRSAGKRWGKTGEGEGGMIGIECVVVRDSKGNVVETRSEILQDYNCGGMFRAWVDDDGQAYARIWREDQQVLGLSIGGVKLG